MHLQNENTFRGATDFANACASARISFRCGYRLVATFS